MFKFLRNIIYNKFIQNVAIVASGTAAAQLVTLAFSPIITRLYGPEVFGVFGSFSAILAILAPLAALSYPVAIILPQDDSDALIVTRLSIFITCVTSLIILLAVTYGEPILFEFPGLEPISSYLYLLPFAMFATGLYAIANQVAVRGGYFKLYSAEKMSNSVFQNGTKSILGYYINTAFILITVMIATLLVSSCLLYLIIRLKAMSVEPERVSSRRKILSYLDVANKYRDFPLYRTPQVILNVASHGLPILFLGGSLGSAAAGYYTLAKMVLSAPSYLLGQAFSTVFYPKLNNAKNNGTSIAKLISSANLGLLSVSLLPVVTVVLFAPELFSFAFGETWTPSGEIARWMSFWIFVSLIARPSAIAIPVLDLQKFYLKFEIVASVLRILMLYLATTMGSELIELVQYFVAVNVLIDIILILYIHIISKSVAKHKANYN